MSQLEIIDDEVLSTVGGGVRPPGAPGGREARDEEGGPRTWGQMGREYAGACASGAAQSAMFGAGGGKRALAKQAAIGCAMGVGMKAIEDITGVAAG